MAGIKLVTAAGILIASASGGMLALSIIQHRRASGRMPAAAFPSQRLVRTGVFGIWRHPVLLSSVLFFGGAGIIFWPARLVLISFPALALFAVLFAKVEEAGLEKRFGRAYDGYRRQTSIVVPRLFHAVRPAIAFLSRLFFRFEVSGRENRALDPPFFVMSAHRSCLDSLFVSLAIKAPVHFVTTFERFRGPASRFIFSRLLALPNRRYRPDVRNALDIRRRLLEGCAVGIFPEGERSWTGAMTGFKPEVLKLLKNNPQIPILPVRLEGPYAVWPRWARGPRRAKVSAFVEKAVFPGRGEPFAELETRLRRLIEPLQVPDHRLKPPAARGIESLLYRCPDCLSFDTIRPGKGPGFRCSNCLARFDLYPDFSVRKSGQDVRESLDGISRRIRAVPENWGSARASCVMSARSELSLEKLGRLEVVGVGRLNLSVRNLTFESGGTLFRIDLGSVRSVIIESPRKLHVYGGRPASLYQFALLEQSVLKWQDAVVEIMRRHVGHSPSTA